MLKIVVTGSRDWTDTARIRRALQAVPGGPHVLLHGDCRGADRIAAGIARNLCWKVEAFPARWDLYGKAAGPIRNREMLEERPDLVLAFPLPGSQGTADCVEKALRLGLKVKVAY